MKLLIAGIGFVKNAVRDSSVPKLIIFHRLNAFNKVVGYN